MNREEFDAMLMENLSEVAPGEVVTGVTPWRNAMNNVLWGIAMNAITLNFLCLDYILTAVGMIMMLLGFRTLRRENVWFKLCYIFSAVCIILFWPRLIVNATIYQKALFESPFFINMIYVKEGVRLALMFSLWQAIRAVQKKINIPPHAGGVIAMIIWHVVIGILILSGSDGGDFGFVIVIAYIFIIGSLFKTAKELDKAGYAIQASKVKISNGMLAGIITAVLTIGIIGGYTLFSKYPMEWTVQSQTEHDGVADIKAELIKLGFPEDILHDLTAEEIKACEGAVHVIVNVEEHSVNESDRLRSWNEEDNYDEKELRITCVAVRLPGEEEKWQVFHHLLFLNNTDFCGTEAVWLWPADSVKGWVRGNDVIGRVLYTKDNVDYTSPYYSLASEIYTINSFIQGDETSVNVFGTFSMPDDGKAHRCYVSYVFEATEGAFLANAWVNFVHQKSLINYPVVTAKDSQEIEFGSSSVFELVQDKLVFDPWK